MYWQTNWHNTKCRKTNHLLRFLFSICVACGWLPNLLPPLFLARLSLIHWDTALSFVYDSVCLCVCVCLCVFVFVCVCVCVYVSTDRQTHTQADRQKDWLTNRWKEARSKGRTGAFGGMDVRRDRQMKKRTEGPIEGGGRDWGRDEQAERWAWARWGEGCMDQWED